MAIGRLVSLLGLSPNTAPHPQTDDQLHDKAITSAESGDSRLSGGQNNDSDMATQIKAVLGAIRQLHENASEDGAGMAFSRAGTALQGSIEALGHLLGTARDTREPLPTPITEETAKVMTEVESDMDRLASSLDDRHRRQPTGEHDRAHAAANTFMTEMKSAVAVVRGFLGPT